MAVHDNTAKQIKGNTAKWILLEYEIKVLNKNPTHFVQPLVTYSQFMSCLKAEHPWEFRILHHCNYYNLFIYLEK